MLKCNFKRKTEFLPDIWDKCVPKCPTESEFTIQYKPLYCHLSPYNGNMTNCDTGYNRGIDGLNCKCINHKISPK